MREGAVGPITTLRRQRLERAMRNVKVEITKMRRTQNCLEVGRTLLIEMLRSKGIEVPDDVQLYVMVPGGADWSNTALDIEEGAREGAVTLRVVWVDETMETESTQVPI